MNPINESGQRLEEQLESYLIKNDFAPTSCIVRIISLFEKTANLMVLYISKIAIVNKMPAIKSMIISKFLNTVPISKN